MNPFLEQLLHGLALLGLAAVLFYLAKLVNDWATPYDDDAEIRQGNVAKSLVMAGYYLGVAIVMAGAILGPSQGLIDDLILFGGYSALGVALLNVSRWVNDKFIQRTFCNIEQIIEKQNIGAAMVLSGSYVASALVIAGAVHGEGGGVDTAVAFFALGQVVLVLFTYLYDRLTPFDIHQEIDSGNFAAGIAFGGTLIALGIILMKGTMGDFYSWTYNLTAFGLDAVSSMILLPIVRLLFDKIIIPHSDLNAAIRDQRNMAAGVLEMTIAIAFAVLIFLAIEPDPGLILGMTH